MVHMNKTHTHTHTHTHTPNTRKRSHWKGLFGMKIRDAPKHSGQKNSFLVLTFLIFLSNRFAMLHMFYKQLRSGDSIESCL